MELKQGGSGAAWFGWCEIYADDAGRLVIEDHEIASDVRVTFLRPMPFWRLKLPFRCYPAKMRVVS